MTFVSRDKTAAEEATEDLVSSERKRPRHRIMIKIQRVNVNGEIDLEQ